jgi:dihydrodipicolinate synthase/N-acetylneuraminate lyase
MRTPPRAIPALITPFTESGDLDVAAHAFNLRALSAQGVDGFLVAGSTGEGPYLEAGERRILVETARTTLGESVYVIGGVSAESVRQAMAQIDEHVDGGADAALVVTPTSLARGNHAAVARFFGAVAEASALPIFLYSVPAVTGYEIPVDTVQMLAGHANILGMKDSGGRPVRTQELARSIDEPFMMFSGASRALAPSIAAGGYGAISASSNYAFALVTRLIEATGVSRPRAEELQAELTALIAPIEAHGIIGTKTAAQVAGLRAGWPRLPLIPLPAGTRAQIAAEVAKIAA